MRGRSGLEVRLLGLGEEGVLVRVAEGVFDDPIDTSAVQEFLADPRHLLAVAVDDGLVVGFASAVSYLHPDEPRPELWVNEVGVAPTHRRRGLARELLDGVLRAGRDAGCTEAWVLTERSNEPAMRLYQAVGGKEAKEETVLFAFPLDEAGPWERG